MKLSTNTLLGSLVLCTIMIGCGSNDPVTQTNDGTNNGNGTPLSTRFVPITMNNQIIMQDTTTNLEWANGAGGCHPMVPGKSEAVAFNEAVDHCDAMNFASHTDWRLPTITEIQKFTVDMQNAGITPFYQNPACPRLVGYNDDNTTIQNTNTHNTPPIGTITPWGELNAGVRCVRDLPTGM